VVASRGLELVLESWEVFHLDLVVWASESNRLELLIGLVGLPTVAVTHLRQVDLCVDRVLVLGDRKSLAILQRWYVLRPKPAVLFVARMTNEREP